MMRQHSAAVVAVLALLLVCHTEAAEKCAKEKNGNVVIQAENTRLTPGWRFGRSVRGYTGRGYITWFGGDEYQFRGRGMLKYRICVTGGTYRVNIWSMRLRKDNLRDDEGNDAYIKVQGEWTKLFTSFGDSMNTWKLSYLFDINHVKREPMIQLRPGCQYFEVAGRSEMYSLDRFILVKSGSTLDMNAKTTPCSATTARKGPATCQVPKRAPSPVRGTRVRVTFKNRKNFTVRVFRRTASGGLKSVAQIRPGKQARVNAKKLDQFFAIKKGGSCLSTKLTVGRNGRIRSGAVTYSI